MTKADIIEEIVESTGIAKKMFLQQLKLSWKL